MHPRVAPRSVVEGAYGSPVLELAREAAAVVAGASRQTRRGALAIPHLAAGRSRTRRGRLDAVGLEWGRRDDGAPVHEAVVAIQHGTGQRLRAEAGQLGGEHQRQERRVAARRAGRHVERVVAELALDVLREPATDTLDALAGAHRLHDPR